MNIIDVSGDDQLSQVDLMKHMTEEKDTRSFSKKGKDMPSAQQRRKHQITYLAHQVGANIFLSGDLRQSRTGALTKVCWPHVSVRRFSFLGRGRVFVFVLRSG